jgi:hypothetical protein
MVKKSLPAAWGPAIAQLFSDEIFLLPLKVGTATCHKLPKKGNSAVRRN